MEIKNKINVKKLNFFYGDFHALKDIDLQIEEKRITAFIGHSGSGKSTLLRTFNRIYSLYPHYKATGEIYLDGVDILSIDQDLTRLRQRVGMVFQKPTCFPMTIEENISFGVNLYEKLKSHAMEERIEWSLRKAVLWDEVKDKLKQDSMALSYGQQQRLCIARAIAVKPEVLLFDEPTSSLDPKSTNLIERLLVELREDYTIVLVTHNLKQAKKVSDFTAHIYQGGLIEFNKTSEVFINPAHEVTQEYIQEY